VLELFVAADMVYLVPAGSFQFSDNIPTIQIAFLTRLKYTLFTHLSIQ